MQEFFSLQSTMHFYGALAVTIGMLLLSMGLLLGLVLPFLLAYTMWGLSEGLALYNPFDRSFTVWEAYLFWLDHTFKGVLPEVAEVFNVRLWNVLSVDMREHWIFGTLVTAWRFLISVIVIAGAVLFVRWLARQTYRYIKGSRRPVRD